MTNMYNKNFKIFIYAKNVRSNIRVIYGLIYRLLSSVL